MSTATETTIRTVNATVTAYEGEESCDWAGYVAERLAEIYPGADVDVSYSRRNEAFAGSDPLEDFADLLADWWDDLCNQPDHPAWGEDGEDVEMQIEVRSVTASSAGDYEAQVSITVGDETYEGTVTLREDTSRPSRGRRLGTCGAPLDGWASDQVIDALAAAEGAGLDRVAIVGEIEAHVTEAAAPRAAPRAEPRYAVLVCGHIVGRYDSLSEAEAEADRLNADECDDIVGDGAASVWDTWTE